MLLYKATISSVGRRWSGVADGDGTWSLRCLRFRHNTFALKPNNKRSTTNERLTNLHNQTTSTCEEAKYAAASESEYHFTCTHGPKKFLPTPLIWTDKQCAAASLISQWVSEWAKSEILAIPSSAVPTKVATGEDWSGIVFSNGLQINRQSTQRYSDSTAPPRKLNRSGCINFPSHIARREATQQPGLGRSWLVFQ